MNREIEKRFMDAKLYHQGGKGKQTLLRMGLNQKRYLQQ